MSAELAGYMDLAQRASDEIAAINARPVDHIIEAAFADPDRAKTAMRIEIDSRCVEVKRACDRFVFAVTARYGSRLGAAATEIARTTYSETRAALQGIVEKICG